MKEKMDAGIVDVEDRDVAEDWRGLVLNWLARFLAQPFRGSNTFKNILFHR